MDNNIETEEWRDIEGYEGLYQVSNCGRVKSLDRLAKCGKWIMLRKGIVLKAETLNCGYLLLGLNRDGKKKMFTVHRLVAKAFPEICGRYEPNLEVDHINTIRTDNRAENLHWVTRKENMNNPITKESMGGENAPWFGKFGKRHPKSKPIIQMDRQGNFLAEFDCTHEAERKLGISQGNIIMVLKGRRKTAGGFKWKYKTA